MKIKAHSTIAIIVIIALLGSMLPKVTADANDENFTYTDNGDGTATITGYNGPEGVDIVIPSELNGLEVTEIADGGGLLTGVFSHKNLTAIGIPDSITSIGDNAFNDNNLTEVTIPDSVKRIGASAFRNNGLEAIIIPKSVTDMGGGVFFGNQHTTTNLTIYGFTGSAAQTYANDSNHTFRPLDTAPSVNIQYGGETVADELQVNLQSSGELEAVYSHSADVVEIVDVLWTVDGEVAGTEGTLPLESYTDIIGERTVTLTVETNYGITATVEMTLDVILPAPDQPKLQVDSKTDTLISLTWESVPYVDEYILLRDQEEVYRGTGTSFEDEGLEPGTAYDYSLMAENASGTSEVSTITATTDLPPEFDYTDNGDGTATIEGWNDDVGDVPSDLVIPEEIDGLTVTMIRDGDFFDNAFGNLSIDTLSLPDTLEYIGSYAFMDNDIESVEIPDNVTEIGMRAFMDNEIRSLVLPDGLEGIIGSAFTNNSLESLLIPDSVTFIGASAFQNNNLESLTIPSSVTEIGNAAFSSNNLTSVDIPDSVTVIGASVFNRNNLKSIEIPDSVTEIRQNSFRANSLESVTIPDSVTNIGNYAFQENNLTSVTILNDAMDFGSDVFRDNAAPFNLYGWDGSTTDDYANNRGYTFYALDSEPDVTIMYNDEDVGGELFLNYEETGQLEAEYNHPIANIEQVTWIVNGSEASTNETLDISDYTSAVQSLDIELHVETEYGAVGESSVEITVKPPVPNTPSLTIDSTDETEIHLRWGDVQYAEEYILARDGEEVYAGTSTSYEDTGLEPDTAYEYRLVAVNESGTSGASEVSARTDLPIPNTPNLSVDSTDETEIHLRWGDVQYAEEYILARDGEEVYTGTSTSYEDTGLEPDTAYEYSLVAVNESGKSGASEVSARTDLPIPNTPNLSIVSTDETEIHLRWDDVQYAEEYILARDGEEVYAGTSTSYEDTGLEPGTIYNYSLVARNDSGVSDESEVDEQTRYPIPNNIDFELQDHEGNNLLQDTSLDEVWFNQDLYVDVTVDGHEDDTYEYAFVPHGDIVSDWQSEWNGERLEIMDIIEGDGVLDLHIRITNGDGEVVEAVFGPIQIDRAPPTIDVNIITEDGALYMLGDWVNQPVTVQVDMNDSLSGIAEQTISIDGGQTWSSYEEPIYLTDDGRYTIEIVATDHAGNMAFDVQESINIDQSRPSGPSILPSHTGWTNEPVDITIEDGDAGLSGVAYTEYKVDGLDEAWQRYDGPFTLSEEGQYIIYARTFDRAGNVTTDNAEAEVRIDQTPPTLTLAGAKDIVMEVGTTYDEPGYTAFDEREGETMDLTDAVRVQGSVDPSTPGEYTITYAVTDDVGNSTVQERTIHVVDIIGLDIDDHTRDVTIGETVALAVEPTYADHVTPDVTHTMYYESSDDAIATVDGEGHISFHDRGNVEITVTYGPIERKVMFYVGYPTVNTGESREVVGGSTYRIHGLDRDVVITMPSDLPENTSVRVEKYDVDEDKIRGFNQAGPLLTFTFNYGNGDAPDRSDMFTLTMGYDEHISPNQVGVYYLNESHESSVWEYRGGEVNEANQTITIYVSHFSTYGVFEDTEAPDIHTFDALSDTDRVTLNFNASDASGIKAYHIERDGTRIDTLDGDTLEYVDERLRENTSYTYKLIAVDPLGNTRKETLTVETMVGTTEEEIPEKDPKEEGGSESGEESGTVEKNKSSGSDPSGTSRIVETLPNTATSYYNIILIGIMLLALGISMLLYGIWRKKMDDKSSKV